MSIVVRLADYSDRDAILRLALLMGGHEDLAEHAEPMRALGAALQQSEARLLVAQREGRIVGYAELQARATTIHDRCEGWLGALAVDPQLRGTGVGTHLLAAVDREAALLGCTHVVLESSQWRDEAHRFYRSRRFVEQTPALRFERPVISQARSMEERFLEAAAAAARAVGMVIGGLAQANPVGIGADGAPTEAADQAAEEAALELLAPLGLPIVSEERGLVGTAPASDEPWIAVDPLDGSRNFRAGYAPYATAFGLVVNGAARVGLVCELTSGRRWWAISGRGAFADSRPIHARRGTLVGYPSPTPGQEIPRSPGDAQRIRISGSTTVDLCRVADGTLGGFVALDRPVVHVHDLAGPLAVLQESGAHVVGEDGALPLLVPDPRITLPLVACASAAMVEELFVRTFATRK
ncbi:MAG TPA: inositol monophosphatase family protein [Candidatus Acidoferrales bacterium]|nr:inositol monophosphatase family protein [Candidatus Acidoferrales bacterium]